MTIVHGNRVDYWQRLLHPLQLIRHNYLLCDVAYSGKYMVCAALDTGVAHYAASDLIVRPALHCSGFIGVSLCISTADSLQCGNWRGPAAPPCGG
jgi:hypothetical protein